MCWISIITNPKANSAAEKIKKKNVNESMLTLSKIKPISKTIIYKDIHISSAVNKRCRAVFTLSIIVRKKQKNRKKNVK
jgi:transketolase C-terminal domain/subunit